jgi:hypothetical protein
MEVVRKGCLSINRPECLQCSHLVPFAENTEDCTVDSGNDLCPAQSIQIVIGVNIKKASEDIAAAMRSHDPVRIGQKMEKVAALHESVQRQVMSAVDDLMGRTQTPNA